MRTLFAIVVLLLMMTVGCIAAQPSGNPSASDKRVVERLKKYLAESPRPELDKQPFATIPLSRSGAEQVRQLLWEDHVATIRETRAEEMRNKVIELNGKRMRFDYRVFGEKPEGGRSLFISLHGGGNAAPRVNDQQWENQKILYQPEEGVYVAPRAPTDTWNLWHEGHIDDMFDRLIENMIVFEDVNPDRVYVMGYSAGGDGVYQLAPRMADRWAAAAMMAGHPNDASPLGLRNIAFTIQMGGRDSAYNRNGIAQEWAERLAKLKADDPDGYEHWVEIYPQFGHWMNRVDRAAVPWMARYTRRTFPDKVVWHQSSRTHNRFYWLAVDEEHRQAGATVVARRDGQTIIIESCDVPRLHIRLNDQMLNLDQPVTVEYQGKQLFFGKVKRTTTTIAQTLAERGDPKAVYCAEIVVDITR